MKKEILEALTKAFALAPDDMPVGGLIAHIADGASMQDFYEMADWELLELIEQWNADNE